ncbi:transposase [Methylobacterium sp. E-025]|uniref:IS66 family transposase n=1 Tax=unclassified Methylobacterium TaxID=2615210 RepID=UPI00391D489B
MTSLLSRPWITCVANNAAERLIRPIAVDRRNWTFVDSNGRYHLMREALRLADPPGDHTGHPGGLRRQRRDL